MKLLTLIN